MPKPLALEPARTLLLLVDIQERLCPAMPPRDLERLLKYAKALLGTARELGIPVVTSEQYPRGLGQTLPTLRNELKEAPLEKVQFSCAKNPALAQAIAATKRQQIVMIGMETHVCVFQTARDLVAEDYEVQVCADAVASRTEEHRRVGLDLCRDAGALVTTAETAIFDLLHEAGSQSFKNIAPLVK